jgi:hypothetical protein
MAGAMPMARAATEAATESLMLLVMLFLLGATALNEGTRKFPERSNEN